MSTWIKHYNHNHDPRNGQFTSTGRILTKEEKNKKKLNKKWNYIEPKNKKEAHKHIAKKALISGATIGAGQIGTQMYINKKIMNKPISDAFNKKTATQSAILGLITGASNAAYDEILYARKGVIRR